MDNKSYHSIRNKTSIRHPLFFFFFSPNKIIFKYAIKTESRPNSQSKYSDLYLFCLQLQPLQNMNKSLKINSLVTDLRSKIQNYELKKDVLEIIKSYMRPTGEGSDFSEGLFFKNAWLFDCYLEQNLIAFWGLDITT